MSSSHEPSPGVGYARRTCIADHRDNARSRDVQQLAPARLEIMFRQADEFLRFARERRKPSARPGILSGDEVRMLEDAAGAWREIAEIADWRGNYVDSRGE